MRKWALLILCVFAYTPAQAADPSCKYDPTPLLARSVVELYREFEPEEVYVNRETFTRIHGIKGTAWFVDSQTLVTISHVVTSSKIGGDWKEVTLSWSDAKDEKISHSLKVQVRIKDIVVGIAALEPIITLEIKETLGGVKKTNVRASPLTNNEPVVGIGYRDGALRFAKGHLAYPEPSENEDDNSQAPPPYLPFEIYDSDESKNDRYVFNHGASGAPLFDCDGNVVAVVQALMIRTLTEFAGQKIEVTTPWGMANMTGVSTIPLLDRRHR